MKPAEFWEMTFEDTTYVLQGYRKRNEQQLQNTRMIMYSIISTVTKPEERGNVYDMFYLPGDPTAKERMEVIANEHAALLKENEKLQELIRKENEEKKRKLNGC